MENVQHRKNIKLVHNERMFKRLVCKPSFEGFTIFNDDLVAVNNKWLKLKLNKPIYTGFTVLDLSKLFMYDFHYNYIKRIYNNNARLLMTDTDSLFYCIETSDVYRDMYDNLHLFDTSNYPEGSLLHSNANKRVMGCPIIECVCLRAKMYSFITQSKNNSSPHEVKKAKGVIRSVVKSELTHDLYKETLFDSSFMHSSMNTLQSEKHQMYLKTINKLSPSCFDDKRCILDDGIHTLAHGHYKIVQKSTKSSES